MEVFRVKEKQEKNVFRVYEWQINMVLNVHRNHKAYYGRGEGGDGGMEVGQEGEYIPIAPPSPPE